MSLQASSQGLAEIVLVVENVVRSAMFYREVVGLVPITEPEGDWAWFWAGKPDTPQRLGLRRGSLLFEEHSPRPKESRFGPVHFAFAVNRSDLMDVVQQVRAAGVEVYGPTHFNWMRAEFYYFYDPDGNLLEWWSPELTEKDG